MMTAPISPVLTVREMAKVAGISTNTICLIRKAGRILGDPVPNYATPEDILSWLKRWPQFVAKDWEKNRWQDRLAKYNAQDRREQLVSKFGGK